jgi:dihydrofolate reductase
MKAIVAMTRNRVIGQNNKIPWRLRGEQKWFQEVTMGHPILMGRKTFESIGRPLPGRRNLVVTRTGNFAGVDLIRDLNAFDPTSYESHDQGIFVIGGAEIYQALLDRCDTIYATIVKKENSIFSSTNVAAEFTLLLVRRSHTDTPVRSTRPFLRDALRFPKAI